MRTPIETILNKQRDCRGSALLVVLIMLGVVAILVTVASRSISGAAREMGLSRSVSLSQAGLYDGVELGVAAIRSLGDNMRSAEASTDLAGRRISVRITNERGRIDLNVAPKSMLSALFVAVGIARNEADALATAVDDWRGGSASQKLAAATSETGPPRALPGLNAFSTSTDRQKAPKQTVGTRYFLHPAQLASVPGFTKQVVKSILPFVTLGNGLPRIDPYIATEEVLEALPGTTADQARAFLSVRDGNTSRETALTMLGANKDALTDTAAMGWRLEITTTPRVGRAHKREVVVAVAKNSDKPYHVMYAGADE